MKKFFLPLTGLTISLAAATSVVSCIKAAYSPGEIGERLMLITDTAPVTDKSINQALYEAIVDYSGRAMDKEKEQGGFNFYKRGLSAKNNFIQPLKKDYDSFVSAYKVGILKGADIMVLSGFLQETSVPKASELIGKDKTIIFIDSMMQGPSNVITIPFASQLAGFAAGYDAAVWASQIVQKPNGGWKYQGSQFNDHQLSFATYAGIGNKNATNNYMWGYLVAIDYFNKNNKINGKANPDGDKLEIKLANAGRNKSIADGLSKGIEDANPMYFTGSFELGGGGINGLNETLLINQADVIFPIAGPQILNTLTYSNKPYLIGVDTDQGSQFPAYKERFITSALKNLKQSTQDAIDRSKGNRLNHNPDGSLKEKPWVAGVSGSQEDDLTNNYWDGHVAPPQNDWSTDLDWTDPKTGEPTNKNVGSKIVKTLLDYENDKGLDAFVKEMIRQFNKTGPESKTYLNYESVSGMADWIIANLQLPLDPIK
ncbi:basic membrane lipoprotein Med (substrate-binding protein (PBP1-ABC) superfamily) [Entomoplasma freundtii]|uniref:Ribose/galactose ABC transporter substrate-binding protein n=1 Tax=Entomoplasma freundtii TaxID=74700 RepID=A0A2K8NS19_9MOLU|nr:BMP family ABC transporter substrate-binding protein [Entomoplasma freundtii]ATZ16645.1 ribose/galactose ABC transporter substrate-binding protein [Entomoplasma freundtii]TDY58188.1 basic membrane lipoprotein Med (substrate-binding protein (PBP1-ABC) superfamily) [Entomoplasma freundtii]